MGYDGEKKGSKLLDLNQPHKYFVERSIVFDEGRFPAKEFESKKDVTKIGHIAEKTENSLIHASNCLKNTETDL